MAPPLLFPDDLDEDFVPGSLAYEWDRLGKEIRNLGVAVAVEVEQTFGGLVSRPLTALSRVFYRD